MHLIRFTTIIFIILITVIPANGLRRIELVPPETGVTDQFVTPFEVQHLGKKLYDFDKLKKDYGLVVFGFKIKGHGKGLSHDVDSIEGLRVWEMKFDKDDPDTIVVDKEILLQDIGREVGLSLNDDGLSAGRFSTNIRFTFHKNRIVYAGNLYVNLARNIPRLFIEGQYRQDCGQWYNTYKEFLEGIPIDIILMEFLDDKIVID